MSKKSFSISIIGSGNAAFALSEALFKVGHTIVEIIGRNVKESERLAAKVNAKVVNMATLNQDIDLLLIAVNDDAISSVAKKLPALDILVAHCAGSVSIDALCEQSKRGVFYPFVSMKKEIATDFSTAQFFVEASDDGSLFILTEIAHSLSPLVYSINSEQRGYLHLSAVFAHNFVNNQLVIAQKLLEKKGMPFEYLRPLMQVYFDSLQNHVPSELQTGPAIRGDEAILQKHLNLLENHPDYKSIYLLLTKSIQQK